jgi:hypothetical protein
MNLIESLISEKNQHDLLYSILLSVKSKNPTIKISDGTSKGKTKLESHSISISKSNHNKTDIASFSITIEREEIPRLFSKNTYKYNIRINGDTRGYSRFESMYFRSELLSDRCSKVIGDIFDYLFNIEEERKIEETNNKVLDIISDISTTVDQAYKRDNKIDEVLNNN